ncbi:MAG: glycosyltransferase family 2 protein [Xanthomonadales bacterium]
MKLSIVLPVFNEEAMLENALDRIASVLQSHDIDFEMIAVDDGSTDRTWSVIERVAATATCGEHLRGVRFSRNFGKEAAICAGLRQASGEAVVVMDADLQHPPEVIPEMVELWSNGGFSVVEGIKRNRQSESMLRRLSALFFYRVLKSGTAFDLRNSTDFKLLDRGVVDTYLQFPEYGRLFRGLTAWIGLPTAAIELDIPERAEGRSAWRVGALIDLARSTIVSFTALPLHLISWIGLLGFVVSIVLALQTLWNKLFGDSAEGFPTVILLILGMGSLILLSLGIIGEYLSELYREVKGRPLYVVRETLGAEQSSDQSKKP